LLDGMRFGKSYSRGVKSLQTHVRITSQSAVLNMSNDF